MTKVKQIKNQQELESVINADFESLDEAESILPFGQFKGQSIEDVPNYYLEWIVAEDITTAANCYNYLLEPVEKELAYRKEFDIFITEE